MDEKKKKCNTILKNFFKKLRLEKLRLRKRGDFRQERLIFLDCVI